MQLNEALIPNRPSPTADANVDSTVNPNPGPSPSPGPSPAAVPAAVPAAPATVPAAVPAVPAVSAVAEAEASALDYKDFTYYIGCLVTSALRITLLLCEDYVRKHI
ncbi:hypothetical protein BU26DRAFT_511468 [Trematosphaeria pertusa]|uniref:Uncharacterized protein n=1 Tax=Trematosphaeria pertusa TaxID=390896 RepID=A0A6A6HTX4_9PLEO|nr:uncharacterized protein BU26DRAFT_511468 [Trematosphaeria pertusa]KAF2241369.1 hypothetical protein BU26DRAFT_511468 [Trematosphaeria pertusa]